MTAEKSKKRLDKFLTEKRYTSSRERAQELIRQGKVEVNGRIVSKSSLSVTSEDEIELQEQESPWVSRGALKLEKALDHWQINVSGKKCLDVGACTGGFTQLLLHRGAKKVYALDVGRGQLAKDLKKDKRIVNWEGANAREMSSQILPEKPELIAADVSYISLTLVLPKMADFLSTGGDMIVLIKPQFEVGRKNVKKGVVRDEQNHTFARQRIEEAGRELELKDRGTIESPITGDKGNKEFLKYFQK